MKILIIGGTSSVAKALIPELTTIGKIVTAGRKDCNIQLDLNNTGNEIDFDTNFDVVIHTAAHFGGNTYNEILNAEYENVIGTLKLCEAANKANTKHFILISSIYAELNENENNYGIYGISKRHAEEVATFYCKKNNLPLTIIRPTLLYGNNNSFSKHQPLIYAFIDKAQNDENIEIYGKKDIIRNYLHIEDLAIIIRKVIEKKITGTFSTLNTENNTISQIAQAAINAFNGKSKFFFSPEKPDIAENNFLLNNNLYDLIDYKPSINIQMGMKKIANYRRNTNV